LLLNDGDISISKNFFVLTPALHGSQIELYSLSQKAAIIHKLVHGLKHKFCGDLRLLQE
jgi:hypothetical protein